MPSARNLRVAGIVDRREPIVASAPTLERPLRPIVGGRVTRFERLDCCEHLDCVEKRHLCDIPNYLC